MVDHMVITLLTLDFDLVQEGFLAYVDQLWYPKSYVSSNTYLLTRGYCVCLRCFMLCFENACQIATRYLQSAWF